MNSRYCELLHDAVSCLNNPSSVRTYAHWRGDGDLREFVTKHPTRHDQTQAGALPQCLVVVEVARWALSEDAPETLLPQWTGHNKELSPHQFVQLMLTSQVINKKLANPLFKGICHATSAAICYRARDYKGLVNHLGDAAGKFDKAWRLTTIRTAKSDALTISDSAFELSSGDEAAAVMTWATEAGAFGSDGVLQSTYLALHRILGRILGSPQSKLLFPNELQVLFARDDEQGVVHPIRFEKVEATLPTVFIDPIDFGITPLSLLMSDSIRLAWRCCRPSNQTSHKESNASFPAIRIRSDLAMGIGSLGGPSAGALFAAGMIATMRSIPLDANRSATCCLRLTEEQLKEDDLKPLQPRDLKFDSVGQLAEKLDEVWFGDSGISEVFVCEADKTTWEDAHPNWLDLPRVESAGKSLHDLIERLTGNQRFDRILEQQAGHLFQQWGKIAAFSADPDAKVVDRDHRFDCYIAPTLRVEGPLREEQQKPDQTPSGRQMPLTLDRVGDGRYERETAVVPGSNETGNSSPDESLLCLLKLMLQNQCWDEAPKWLIPGNPIVIYDNAGAGKTVCSHRMLKTLADPANRVQLFGYGAQPLLVRIEGSWPHDGLSDQRKLLSLRAMLIDALRKSPSSSQLNDDLLDQTVEHALGLRRVVLIIDGFDQFSPEDRELVIEMFSDRHAAGYRDAARCHLIVASRVHTINEYRSRGRYFVDKQWNRVRIEPLSRNQQDAYFAQEDAAKFRIGDAWLKMVADREVMEELLSLPMVLAMIRLLFEEAYRDGKAPPMFATLSELYVVTARKLLHRALDRNRKNPKLAKIPVHLSSGAELEKLEHALSLIAFQMMLMEEYDGRIEQREMVTRFKSNCRVRFVRGVIERDETIDEATAGIEWDWAISVLQTLELNHRSVTELNNDDGIVFRSRKMLECHAARYLTRYATERDIFAGDDENDMPIVERGNKRQKLDTLCAWNYTTHPDWRDTWLIAIEMPHEPINGDGDAVISEAVIDHEATCRSLSALFRLPKAYTARDIRPTELIYRAWHLFELDEQILRERFYRVDGLGDEQDRQLVYGRELAKYLGTNELVKRGSKFLLGSSNSQSSIHRLRTEVIEQFRVSSRELVESFERLSMDEAKLARMRTPEFDGPTEASEFVAFLDEKRIWSGREFIELESGSMLEMPNNASSEVLESRATYIQSALVTRSMYRWFDPNFASSSEPAQISFGPTETIFEAPIREIFFIQEIEAKLEGLEGSLPMTCISNYDAFVFCRWLGEDYRLPTKNECLQFFIVSDLPEWGGLLEPDPESRNFQRKDNTFEERSQHFEWFLRETNHKLGIQPIAKGGRICIQRGLHEIQYDARSRERDAVNCFRLCKSDTTEMGRG